MPIYEYRCRCGQEFERNLKMSDSAVPQQCICGLTAEKIISESSFVLVGNGWPGKAMKTNSQIAGHNKKLAPRFEEKKREEPLATLAPNVDGEVVSSWKEAKDLARTKGKDTTTYDQMIKGEIK